jgi:hypothetical protein
MKTKQEMELRSLYMPKSYWKGIDEVAEKEDLSANQVIRKLVISWLTGMLVIRKDEAAARPGRKAKRAPLKTKTNLLLPLSRNTLIINNQ